MESFIIESKSCLGEISYNKYDEWKRKTKNYQTGFQSPIKQVERQYDILIKNLDMKTPNLFLEKSLVDIKMYLWSKSKTSSLLQLKISSILNKRRLKKIILMKLVMKSDSKLLDFIQRTH